ncbi:hypothetical protein PanWU01x14_039780 [Parasponia andersonii]|uniref:Uncharacterized protein n=1 Tax=Parasponia andersonii TaxID=3476 RepID=A0A2P5DR10_PARAD|nr:hypothetical protein PanWU01x14_039780 [Parasponia andersonii]
MMQLGLRHRSTFTLLVYEFRDSADLCIFRTKPPRGGRVGEAGVATCKDSPMLKTRGFSRLLIPGLSTFSHHDLLHRSRVVITVISLASLWPAFHRPLQLGPVGGETLTNRRSVIAVCSICAPIQDRIKCLVWVWSSALPLVVFWWKTLEASDPHLSRQELDWVEPSGVWDGFGPSLGQPMGSCGITCDSCGF